MYDDNEDVEDEYEQNEMDEEIEENHKKRSHRELNDLDLMGGFDNKSFIDIPDYAGHVDKKIRSKNQDSFFDPDSWF